MFVWPSLLTRCRQACSLPPSKGPGACFTPYCTRTDRMFVQKLNTATGEMEWVVVQAPGEGMDGDASADLVAGSSYLDMLTDTRRNKAYKVALNHALTKAHTPSHTPSQVLSPPRVLDIGTGTGLLAMMAAKALDQHWCSTPSIHPPPEQPSTSPQLTNEQPPPTAATAPLPCVLACEVFPPMAAVARRVIAANGMQNKIIVVNQRSDELTVIHDQQQPLDHQGSHTSEGGATRNRTRALHQQRHHQQVSGQCDARPALQQEATQQPQQQYVERDLLEAGCLPERVELVVSEILDSALLGEGVLPTMRHASKHLMKPTAQAIPAAATMWAQLIECQDLWDSTSLSRHLSTHTADPTQDPHMQTTASQLVNTLANLDAQALQAQHVALQAQARQSSACAGDQQGVLQEGCKRVVAWQPLRCDVHVGPFYAAGRLKVLSQPVPLLTLDLCRPPDQNATLHGIQVPVTASGTLHGLVYWWQLYLNTHPTEHMGFGTPGSTAGGTSPQGPVPVPVVLSTAPPWIGSGLTEGGDGGPLEGVAQEWRDHWAQCWAPLGVSASPATVGVGEYVTLSVRHDDISVEVGLSSPVGQVENMQGVGGVSGQHVNMGGVGEGGAQKGVVGGDMSAAAVCLAPMRDWMPMGMLGSLHEVSYWEAHAQQLRACLEGYLCGNGGRADMGMQGQDGLRPAKWVQEVVVLGNQGLMLPLVALQCVEKWWQSQRQQQQGHEKEGWGGKPKVVVLVDSVVERGWLEAAAARLGIVAGSWEMQALGPYMKRMRHVAKAAGKGGERGVGQGVVPVSVIVAEPSYRETQGSVPWMALLRFWNDLHAVRLARQVAGGDVTCVARPVVVSVVAVSVPELWRSRQRLHNVEGLDLRVSNQVLLSEAQHASGAQVTTVQALPFSARCGNGLDCAPASELVELMCVDLASAPQSLNGQVELAVSAPCHGLLVKVSYVQPEASANVLPSAWAWRQPDAICLFQGVCDHQRLRIQATLSVDTEDLELEVHSVHI